MEGLVVSYFGQSVMVEMPSGELVQCHLRRNQLTPVVGDRVKVQKNQDQMGIIIELLPRRTVLGRADNRGEMRVIAANVDMLIIVMAPPPIFSTYLVDRYLIAASLLGLEPLIVMNKADLLTASIEAEAVQDLNIYKDVGYKTLMTSVTKEKGLDQLQRYLQSKTAVLVGPSGVGKSSIIALLAKTIPIKVGEVSNKGAGKHTTTATRLYHLPQGGHLIDSPGVREFGLWPVSAEKILAGFKEFEHYLGRCKFKDCKHLVEPGCGVQEAVAAGNISKERFLSYQQLMQTIQPKPNYTKK